MVSVSLKRFSAWTFLVVSAFHFGDFCFVVDDYEMSSQDFLKKSDIIVYGQDLKHVKRWDEKMAALKMNITDCEFHVRCILKSGNGSMDELITIEHIAPKSSCSANYKDLFVEGKEMIVALTPTSSGNFILHEVNLMQSAVFDPTHENFEIVANISDSNTWKPPPNSTVDMCIFARKKLAVSGIEYDYDYGTIQESELAETGTPASAVTGTPVSAATETQASAVNGNQEPTALTKGPAVTKAPVPGPGVQETDQDNTNGSASGRPSDSLPNVGASTDNDDPNNGGVSRVVNFLTLLLTVSSSIFLLQNCRHSD